MRLLSRLTNGIRAAFRRRNADDEVDAELHAFLEAAVDQKMRSGMSREEATRAARVDVGWETRIDTLWQDLRYAGRTLRRNPGFAFVLTATLALGTGATISLFSIVDAVLVRPLPYPEADRTVSLVQRDSQLGLVPFAPPYLQDLREHFGHRHFFSQILTVRPLPRSTDLAALGS